MITLINRNAKRSYLVKIVSILICLTFSVSSITPPAYAQTPVVLNLPMPGTMVPISPGFTPAIVKGITLYPDHPLKFDFIVDTGHSNLEGEAFETEANKLIKYFLAALTIPEKDLWVNLSPYEQNRVIPESFSYTEMGRDLLAQDYILKQLTASLMYPEDEIGEKFWKRVYKKAYDRFGTTDIPMNTFNKVWIIPEDAVVYETGNNAFVVNSRLKVMLDEDYLALQKNMNNEARGTDELVNEDVKVISGVSSEVVREVLIPEIEKEVNEGENFAKLRQIYSSVILAAWYKKNLKESLLGQVYVNQTKIKGIDLEDKQIKEKIYNQYVEAFKKGVYNYIKEDYDPVTEEVIPRKYFSGGTEFDLTVPGRARALSGDVALLSRSDQAIVGSGIQEIGKVRRVGTMFFENTDEEGFQSATAATPPARSDEAMTAMDDRIKSLEKDFYIAGNWKDSLKNEKEAIERATEYRDKFASMPEGVKVVIFVQEKYIKKVAEVLEGSNVLVGVQSTFFNPKRDLQKQIAKAKSLGVTWVNVGHSIHRNAGKGLTDGDANRILRALEADGELAVWYTIEYSEEDAKKRSKDRQIDDAVKVGLQGLSYEFVQSMPITYEPTADITTKKTGGAIDTTATANTQEAEGGLRILFNKLDEHLGPKIAQKVNIGYGAGVKRNNARELSNVNRVQNFMVGGESYTGSGLFELAQNVFGPAPVSQPTTEAALQDEDVKAGESVTQAQPQAKKFEFNVWRFLRVKRRVLDAVDRMVTDPQLQVFHDAIPEIEIKVGDDVPRELRKKLEQGGIEALTEEERAQVMKVRRPASQPLERFISRERRGILVWEGTARFNASKDDNEELMAVLMFLTDLINDVAPNYEIVVNYKHKEPHANDDEHQTITSIGISRKGVRSRLAKESTARDFLFQRGRLITKLKDWFHTRKGQINDEIVQVAEGAVPFWQEDKIEGLVTQVSTAHQLTEDGSEALNKFVRGQIDISETIARLDSQSGVYLDDEKRANIAISTKMSVFNKLNSFGQKAIEDFLARNISEGESSEEARKIAIDRVAVFGFESIDNERREFAWEPASIGRARDALAVNPELRGKIGMVVSIFEEALQMRSRAVADAPEMKKVEVRRDAMEYFDRMLAAPSGGTFETKFSVNEKGIYQPGRRPLLTGKVGGISVWRGEVRVEPGRKSTEDPVFDDLVVLLNQMIKDLNLDYELVVNYKTDSRAGNRRDDSYYVITELGFRHKAVSTKTIIPKTAISNLLTRFNKFSMPRITQWFTTQQAQLNERLMRDLTGPVLPYRRSDLPRVSKFIASAHNLSDAQGIPTLEKFLDAQMNHERAIENLYPPTLEQMTASSAKDKEARGALLIGSKLSLRHGLGTFAESVLEKFLLRKYKGKSAIEAREDTITKLMAFGLRQGEDFDRQFSDKADSLKAAQDAVEKNQTDISRRQATRIVEEAVLMRSAYGLNQFLLEERTDARREAMELVDRVITDRNITTFQTTLGGDRNPVFSRRGLSVWKGEVKMTPGREDTENPNFNAVLALLNEMIEETGLNFEIVASYKARTPVEGDEDAFNTVTEIGISSKHWLADKVTTNAIRNALTRRLENKLHAWFSNKKAQLDQTLSDELRADVFPERLPLIEGVIKNVSQKYDIQDVRAFENYVRGQLPHAEAIDKVFGGDTMASSLDDEQRSNILTAAKIGVRHRFGPFAVSVVEDFLRRDLREAVSEAAAQSLADRFYETRIQGNVPEERAREEREELVERLKRDETAEDKRQDAIARVMAFGSSQSVLQEFATKWESLFDARRAIAEGKVKYNYRKASRILEEAVLMRSDTDVSVKQDLVKEIDIQRDAMDVLSEFAYMSSKDLPRLERNFQTSIGERRDPLLGSRKGILVWEGEVHLTPGRENTEDPVFDEVRRLLNKMIDELKLPYQLVVNYKTNERSDEAKEDDNYYVVTQLGLAKKGAWAQATGAPATEKRIPLTKEVQRYKLSGKFKDWYDEERHELHSKILSSINGHVYQTADPNVPRIPSYLRQRVTDVAGIVQEAYNLEDFSYDSLVEFLNATKSKADVSSNMKSVGRSRGFLYIPVRQRFLSAAKMSLWHNLDRAGQAIVEYSLMDSENSEKAIEMLMAFGLSRQKPRQDIIATDGQGNQRLVETAPADAKTYNDQGYNRLTRRQAERILEEAKLVYDFDKPDEAMIGFNGKVKQVRDAIRTLDRGSNVYNLAVSAPPKFDLDNKKDMQAYVAGILANLHERVADDGKVRYMQVTDVPEAIQAFLRGEPTTAEYRPMQGGIQGFEANFKIGNLVGTKRIHGPRDAREKDKVFALEYKKKGDDKITVLTFKRDRNGTLLIRAVPKKTVLVYGFGTIAGKIGMGLLQMGYNVIATNRKTEKAHTAASRGIKVVPMFTDGPYSPESYRKAGINLLTDKRGNVVTAESYINAEENGLEKIDLIIDGLDGASNVVINTTTNTIVSENGKVVTKLGGQYTQANGYALKGRRNSEVVKEEVFNRFDAPIFYQGSNKPELVSNGVVAETGGLEMIGLDASSFVGKKDVFMPSCNTTCQGSLITALLSDEDLADESLDLLINTTRRKGDPGQEAVKSPADNLPHTDIDYHHAKDWIAWAKQQGISHLMKKFAKSPKNGNIMLATNATNGEQSKFHITQTTIVDARKKDGSLYTVDDVKRQLAKSDRIAVIQPGTDTKFVPEKIMDLLINELDEQQLYFIPAAVYEDRTGRISIMSLTPQESNVIPNNLSSAMLALEAVDKSDVRVANSDANEVFRVPQMKKRLQNRLQDKDFLAKYNEALERDVVELPSLVAASAGAPIGRVTIPKDSRRMFAKATNTSELARRTQGVLEFTDSGIKVLDRDQLRAETIDYLVQESQLNSDATVRAHAAEIIREVTNEVGVKSMSDHDVNMSRGDDGHTTASINLRNGPVYLQARAAIRAAMEKDVGLVKFELAKSERIYTKNKFDEYASVVYAAALKEGYTGPLFLQLDHLQIDAKKYNGDPKKKTTGDPEGALKDAEALMEEAVQGGMYNVNIDPSTLVREKNFEQLIELEHKMTTAFIEARMDTDRVFRRKIEEAKGLSSNTDVHKAFAEESAIIRDIRRSIVNHLESDAQGGTVTKHGRYMAGYLDRIRAKTQKLEQGGFLTKKEIGEDQYFENGLLTDDDLAALRKFSLTSLEKAGKLKKGTLKELKRINKEMHTDTLKANTRLTRFARDVLEPKYGLRDKGITISLGIEVMHVDNRDHRNFPSTVLSAISLMEGVKKASSLKGWALPNQLALQTGTMHGLGYRNYWGSYVAHQAAAEAIGIPLMVQHGTSTMELTEWDFMPQFGASDAHLATDFQQRGFRVITKTNPELADKMVHFMQAIIDPMLQIDAEEQARFDSEYQEIKRGQESNHAKFQKGWKEAFAELPGQINPDTGRNWTEREIGYAILTGSVPLKYKEQLKDLAKLVSAPFKEDIWELSVSDENYRNAIFTDLYNFFGWIYDTLNVTNTRDLVDAKLGDLNTYQEAKAPRSSTLQDAVNRTQTPSEAVIQTGLLRGFTQARETLAKRDLTGQRVVISANLNVTMGKDGYIGDSTRLRIAANMARDLVARGADVVLVGHHGRYDPDPKKDSRMSLEPTVKFFQRQVGRKTPVNFYKRSIAEGGLRITSDDLKIEEGKPGLHIVDSVREAPALEGGKEGSTGREAFGRSLAELSTGILIVEAFADMGSKGARMEDLPRHVKSQAGGEVMVGPGMVEEFTKMDHLLERKVDVLISTGAKNDKISRLPGIISNTLASNGEVWLGSAPSKAADEGDTVINEMLQDSRIKKVSDYSDDKKADIGDKTIAEWTEKLGKLQSGQRVVLNGVPGWVEGGYTKGTNALMGALAKASRRGVEIFIIGGDAGANARNYGMKLFRRWTGLNEGKNVTYFTGGGVILKLLAGEKLVGVEAIREALNITPPEGQRAETKEGTTPVTTPPARATTSREAAPALAAAATQKLGNFSRLLSQNIPEVVRKPVESDGQNRGLQLDKMEVMRLQGSGSPDNIFGNSQAQKQAEFTLTSSIGQALGSIGFAGQGTDKDTAEKVKVAADANAVHFAHHNIMRFTEANPNEAIAVIADEGDRDGSISLKVMRVYHSGFRGGFKDHETLEAYSETLNSLRTQGKSISYFAGDALEHTNGLAVPEASEEATDSWSLSSLVPDIGVNMLPLNDKHFRIAGVSFNAPSDAGVAPFDLPSVAIPKIARARGIEPGTVKYENFVKNYKIVILGAREKDLAKEAVQSGDTRHEEIINDAKELQRQYPGLQVVTPGDGSFASRFVAQLGLNLDGRETIVFGRDGSAEATIARRVRDISNNGQFPSRFVSTESTANLVNEANANRYTNQEKGAFVALGYNDEDLRRVETTTDYKGKGVVAMTAVTGASEKLLGPTLSALLKRVTFDQPDESNLQAGVAVTNTLLQTSEGVFLVRSTFKTANLSATRKSIKAASPEAITFLADAALEGTDLGGIDLNPELLDLQIKRDGNGVPLPVFNQPIQNMRIDGFYPVIINVSPVTSLPLLLGIADDSDEEKDVSFNEELGPLEKRSRIDIDQEEELSFLYN